MRWVAGAAPSAAGEQQARVKKAGAKQEFFILEKTLLSEITSTLPFPYFKNLHSTEHFAKTSFL